MNATEAWDRLVAALDAARQDHAVDDAISRLLAAPPRTTALTELRDEPVMQQFRAELSDALIRADTVRRMLELITTAVTALRAGSV